MSVFVLAKLCVEVPQQEHAAVAYATTNYLEKILKKDFIQPPN
jgi:hypothetical protein